MDYLRTEANGQLVFTHSTDFLSIPSCLYGSHNESKSVEISESGRNIFCFKGLFDADDTVVCCSCGTKMHVNNHFEGIIAHATYNISSGKVERINNKIKTLRRQGYGYMNDEYFFLKIFDVSRKKYVRNPKSHKKSD